MLKVRIYPRLKGNVKLQHLLRKQYAVFSQVPDAEGQTPKKPLSESMKRHSEVFSSAATTGKLLRSSIAPLVPDMADKTASNRLLVPMMEYIKGNLDNAVVGGKGNQGDIHLLRGFQFNSKASLRCFLGQSCNVTFDRTEGVARIEILPILQSRLSPPSKATLFQFRGAVVEMDLASQKMHSTFFNSDLTNVNVPQNSNSLFQCLIQPLKEFMLPYQCILRTKYPVIFFGKVKQFTLDTF